MFQPILCSGAVLTPGASMGTKNMVKYSPSRVKSRARQAM